MNKYKLTITQRAFSDIYECVLFVNNVSNDTSEKLYKEIIGAINSLSEYPNAYPAIDDLIIEGSKIRKMPIHKGRYIILYKVEETSVIVFDIFDTRKDSSILKL